METVVRIIMIVAVLLKIDGCRDYLQVSIQLENLEGNWPPQGEHEACGVLGPFFRTTVCFFPLAKWHDNLKSETSGLRICILKALLDMWSEMRPPMTALENQS